MKLIALGTGNAIVTECYNTCFAIEKDNTIILIHIYQSDSSGIIGGVLE